MLKMNSKTKRKTTINLSVVFPRPNWNAKELLKMSMISKRKKLRRKKLFNKEMAISKKGKIKLRNFSRKNWIYRKKLKPREMQLKTTNGPTAKIYKKHRKTIKKK